MSADLKATWPQWLVTYIDTYNRLNAKNLELLSDIYAQDVVFIDPMSRIDGLAELTEYFEHLYVNLLECHFEVDDAIVDEHRAAIYWRMTMRHKKIKGGEAVTVNGHSKLRVVNDLVVEQVDYFDVASMIYEHVPFVGSVIKMIKRKASH